MALEENGGSNGFFMPVAPAYGGNGGGGFGNWGGDGWWIILLFILLGNNGWGGNNGFGGGGGFGLYPWLNNSNQINDGFRDSMMNDTITSIRDGVFNLSAQLCNGFNTAEIAANGRQMADMQQNFALQTGIANLGVDMAANTQRILDQMCNDKIDSKNEKIADLERQLMMANLAASQIAQTSQIVDQTYNRLSTCPVGTVPVYGETPIFRCNNNGCGCGNNAF